MTRRARFAGSWYPGSAEELRRTVEGYIAAGGPAAPAVGLVAPHAGYVYSGGVAGKGYAAAEVTPSVIVLAPAHRYAGSAVSVWDGGAWQTPLGEVEIDDELLGEVRDGCEAAESDAAAHAEEHSLELQLPFLQVRRPDVRIAPIVVATREAGILRSLGEACATAIKARGADVLMVASSDMTHYESAAAAKEKDEKALARIAEVDPEGLLEVVGRERISMCGASPAAAMLFAARELGARRAETVEYATSGDVTGDTDSVVAYAAVAVRPGK
jgi:AmmeMemoRadiSam system protein B